MLMFARFARSAAKIAAHLKKKVFFVMLITIPLKLYYAGEIGQNDDTDRSSDVRALCTAEANDVT